MYILPDFQMFIADFQMIIADNVYDNHETFHTFSQKTKWENFFGLSLRKRTSY